MLVHSVEASQHLTELIGTKSDHQGKPDSRVIGVATTNPVPKLEHVGGINPELLHLPSISRDSNKMLRYCLLTAQRPDTPLAGRLCVGQRLNSRKGLGRDDKERLCRVEIVSDLHEFVPIDIGDEPHSQVTIAVVFQRII